jgi:hypothetical protein
VDIGQFGLAQQRRDLRLQLRLRLEHPLIAHSLVVGGIGLLLRKRRRLDLGAIQCHRSQSHQTRLLAQPQHLHKQTGHGIKLHPAEITDAAVIRLLVTREPPKGCALPAGPLNPSRTGDADAVPRQQQQNHHAEVVSRHATLISLILGRNDRAQIQLSNRILQKKHQVLLPQPLQRRRRQQQRLLRIQWSDGYGLAHAQFSRPDPFESLESGQIQSSL